MSFYYGSILSMSFLSMCFDLRSEKVPNRLICLCWVIGILWQCSQSGWRGLCIFGAGALLPIFLLLGLFYFRMMGAGDIKILSMLGGMMGSRDILCCMIGAFMTGAAMSLVILLLTGSMAERFGYLIAYFREYVRTGKVKPYYRPGKRVENLHFTVPIFLSVLLYMGGVY